MTSRVQMQDEFANDLSTIRVFRGAVGLLDRRPLRCAFAGSSPLRRQRHRVAEEQPAESGAEEVFRWCHCVDWSRGF